MRSSYRKAGPLRRWWKWLVAVALIAAAVFGMLRIAADPGENLTLLQSAVDTTTSGQRTVTGLVRNNTGASYSYVQLDIDMFADDGTLIATAYSSTSNVAAKSTWKFEVAVPFDNATRFRITRLTCRRNGEPDSRRCALSEPVELPRPNA